MPRGDPQLKLRVSEKLLEAIKLSAQKNNRSMNAEILACLNFFFPMDYDIEGELLGNKEIKIINETAVRIASQMSEELALANATLRGEALEKLDKINAKYKNKKDS